MERFNEWFTYLTHKSCFDDGLLVELDQCERGIYQKISATYQNTVERIFDYAINKLNISSIDQENIIDMINSEKESDIIMGLYYLMGIINNKEK